MMWGNSQKGGFWGFRLADLRGGGGGKSRQGPQKIKFLWEGHKNPTTNPKIRGCLGVLPSSTNGERKNTIFRDSSQQGPGQPDNHSGGGRNGWGEELRPGSCRMVGKNGLRGVGPAWEEKKSEIIQISQGRVMNGAMGSLNGGGGGGGGWGNRETSNTVK